MLYKMSEDYSDLEDLDYPSTPEASEDEGDDIPEVDIDEERKNLRREEFDKLMRIGEPVFEKARKKLDKAVKKIDQRTDIDSRQKEILKFIAGQRIYRTIPNPRDAKRAARDRGKAYELEEYKREMTLPDNIINPKYINPKDIKYEWKRDIDRFPDLKLTSLRRHKDANQMERIRTKDEAGRKYDDGTSGNYDISDRSNAERVGQTTGPSAYRVGLTGDVTSEDEETSRLLRNPNYRPTYGGRMGPILPRRRGRLGTMELNTIPTVQNRGIVTGNLNKQTRDYIEERRKIRERVARERPVQEISRELRNLSVRRKDLNLKRTKTPDYTKPESHKTYRQKQRELDRIRSRIANRSMALEKNIRRQRERRERKARQEMKIRKEREKLIASQLGRNESRYSRERLLSPELEAKERMERGKRKRDREERRKEYYERKRGDRDIAGVSGVLEDLSLDNLPTRFEQNVDQTTTEFFSAQPSGPLTELQRMIALIELENEVSGIAMPPATIRSQALERLEREEGGNVLRRQTRGRRGGGRGKRGKRGRGTRGRK